MRHATLRALRSAQRLSTATTVGMSVRKKPVQRERGFHMLAAQYLDAALPPTCWWTTFPAGGGGKARGGQLKAMGLKPGVSDILVFYLIAADRTGVLWIELKAKGGSLSPEQRAFFERMLAFPSVSTARARTLEQVEAAIQSVGLAPRARLLAGGAWVKTGAAVPTGSGDAG